MDHFQYKPYYERNLPHLQPIDSIFFITYRLAFSFPKHILNELFRKQKELKDNLEKEPLENLKNSKIRNSKILFALEDDFLSKYSHSPMWLKEDSVAELVMEDLLHNHNKKYDLMCALIMPNHVHIVIEPLIKENNIPYSIAEILENHKKYTAHKANKILNREGPFWQRESYDHYIRDDDEFIKIVNYILYNPVAAGLVKDFREWKFYWINQEHIFWCK